MRVAIAVIGLLAVSSGAQAQQFDLACVGTQRIGIDGVPEPHTYGFHIDLESRRWCWSECHRIYDVVSATDDEIVLNFIERSGPRSDYVDHRINRLTGRHDQFVALFDPITLIEVSGECEPRPFTGFPAPRF